MWRGARKTIGAAKVACSGGLDEHKRRVQAAAAVIDVQRIEILRLTPHRRGEGLFGPGEVAGFVLCARRAATAASDFAASSYTRSMG